MAAKLADPRVNIDDSTSLRGLPVKVVVGDTKECFFVHQSVLLKHSEFFKAALKKEWLWTEHEHRVVKLPEDLPKVFETYVQGLYTGKIFTKTGDTERDSDYEHLARIYVLGEKLIDIPFQDAVIDAFAATSRQTNEIGTRWWPDEECVNIIYQNTPANNPARRLMVDMWNAHALASWRCEATSTLAHEFLADLTFALIAKLTLAFDKAKPITEVVPCSYHKHGKDRPCA